MRLVPCHSRVKKQKKDIPGAQDTSRLEPLPLLWLLLFRWWLVVSSKVLVLVPLLLLLLLLCICKEDVVRSNKTGKKDLPEARDAFATRPEHRLCPVYFRLFPFPLLIVPVVKHTRNLNKYQ